MRDHLTNQVLEHTIAHLRRNLIEEGVLQSLAQEANRTIIKDRRDNTLLLASTDIIGEAIADQLTDALLGVGVSTITDNLKQSLRSGHWYQRADAAFEESEVITDA